MVDARHLNILPITNRELLADIEKSGQVMEIPAKTEILRFGQYVKVVPLVIEGLVKVNSQYRDKELLLYYIQPNQSCIMSFAAGINNSTSNVSAVTEEDSTIMLLPADKVKRWITHYPELNNLFYNQYNSRYTELIDSLNHLLFDSLEEKVWNYLEKKVAVEQREKLRLTHHQIAQDLGTSREVISRVLKKLEEGGRLKLYLKEIEIVM